MKRLRNNHGPLRGVNLGGWLVLERWLTPSLFDGTDAADEYSFMQTPGARGKITRHRKTFITKTDFKWISEHGFNAVRIPVGYWIFESDGPYEAGIEYLDKAMSWAEHYGLQVLIDLHGGKNSQNGNDHSGREGSSRWICSRSNRHATLTVLAQIAERYRDSPSLWGIELINEPKINIVTFFMLRHFYRYAYEKLAGILRPGTMVVFSDAFVPRLFSGVIKPMPEHPVALDAHWYQFEKVNINSYFLKLRGRASEIARLQQKQPMIIGEWSGMLSHLTLAGLSDYEKATLEKRHIKEQVAVYETAAGWFYWTYKMESPGSWNLWWLVENGWLSFDTT